MAQAPGYSPLQPAYRGEPHNLSALANNGWVFTTFSRYCPQCLASPPADTNPQTVLWPGVWRLPHTFLCAHHQHFLDVLCPACRTPALSSGRRADGSRRTTTLVPQPTLRLHPAQCRATAHDQTKTRCGHRLDRPGPLPAPSPRPGPQLPALHNRLATAAATATHDEAPNRLFADLHLTLLLMSLSWPAAATHLTGSKLIDQVDAHITAAHRPGQHTDAQPTDPQQSAALYTLTDRVRILSRLLETLPQNTVTLNRERLRRTAEATTPDLKEAIVPRLWAVPGCRPRYATPTGPRRDSSRSTCRSAFPPPGAAIWKNTPARFGT